METIQAVQGVDLHYARATPYYTPPADSKGTAGWFFVQYTHFSGSPTVRVTLETQTTEEGAVCWVSVGAFNDVAHVEVSSKYFTGITERWRLKFEFVNSAVGDFVHVGEYGEVWNPVAVTPPSRGCGSGGCGCQKCSADRTHAGALVHFAKVAGSCECGGSFTWASSRAREIVRDSLSGATSNLRWEVFRELWVSPPPTL